VNEIDALIASAREHRKQRATPAVLVNGYVASIGKHVNGCLQALSKLDSAEGVSEAKRKQAETLLGKLQLPDRAWDEARKTEIRPRNTVKQ
jgi:hypothetical protein